MAEPILKLQYRYHQNSCTELYEISCNNTWYMITSPRNYCNVHVLCSSYLYGSALVTKLNERPSYIMFKQQERQWQPQTQLKFNEIEFYQFYLIYINIDINVVYILSTYFTLSSSLAHSMWHPGPSLSYSCRTFPVCCRITDFVKLNHVWQRV